MTLAEKNASPARERRKMFQRFCKRLAPVFFDSMVYTSHGNALEELVEDLQRMTDLPANCLQVFIRAANPCRVALAGDLLGYGNACTAIQLEKRLAALKARLRLPFHSPADAGSRNEQRGQVAGMRQWHLEPTASQALQATDVASQALQATDVASQALQATDVASQALQATDVASQALQAADTRQWHISAAAAQAPQTKFNKLFKAT